MNKTFAKFLGVTFLLSFAFLSCKEKSLTAFVTMMRGNIEYSEGQSGENKPLKLSEYLHEGDVIHTGANSGVVINIPETGSYIEIQSNAIFRLSSLKKSNIELLSDRGNVWVRTDRKSDKKENYFKLITPTLVAAVRGTTFYSFTIEDMDGVCHCKGNVNLTRNGSDYKAEHHTDNLIISRGTKSVLLTSKDLQEIGLKHNHSFFENSPVGPENELKPEQYKTFIAFLNKKLAEAK